MMAALQSNKEYEKGPKKTFAPPIQKSHNMKPPVGDSLMENIPGIHSKAVAKPTLPEAKPSLPEASLKKKKKKKTETENDPSRGQEKKRKARDKPAERRRKEKSTPTNEEFEEIFQAVLQKSFQECLESSCVQARIHVQPDKEPGVASLATGNEYADGEMAVKPELPEISSSLENEVVSEIRTFKLDQPVPEPPKNKFNRLSLKKRKEEETDEEKVEYIQDEHEHRPEVQQKTAVQHPSWFRGQQKEEKSGFGQRLIWVQCSSSKCEKWRRLRGNIDPSVLPDNWSCDQNPDVNYNCCDIPEEAWTGCDSDVAYASYVPGSIIWAKQFGYPWWPGMVESDPDLGEYFLFASHLDSLPSKYHVTFFGDTVSRAWIPANMLKNFQELSLELTGVKKFKNKDYRQKLGAAVMMAHEAEQTDIQERVNLFGFWSRYNASDDSGEGKELMVSSESCLEKEEKDSVEEKENEEKKVSTSVQPWKRASACDFPDTILLGSKPANIQTKKTKSRDMADGQDRVPKKRALKKSVESKASRPPVPRMGGEEGQRISASDPPGPKKKFKAPESKVSATNLPEDKEVKIVSECPAPPPHHGGCLLVGKEGPGLQEPPVQEAVRFLPKDEASSDLEFEQLMEDVGGESEGGELQHGESSEEFLAVLFEE